MQTLVTNNVFVVVFTKKWKHNETGPVAPKADSFLLHPPPSQLKLSIVVKLCYRFNGMGQNVNTESWICGPHTFNHSIWTRRKHLSWLSTLTHYIIFYLYVLTKVRYRTSVTTLSRGRRVWNRARTAAHWVLTFKSRTALASMSTTLPVFRNVTVSTALVNI